jgi:hypothetical protein
VVPVKAEEAVIFVPFIVVPETVEPLIVPTTAKLDTFVRLLLLRLTFDEAPVYGTSPTPFTVILSKSLLISPSQDSGLLLTFGLLEYRLILIDCKD